MAVDVKTLRVLLNAAGMVLDESEIPSAKVAPEANRRYHAILSEAHSLAWGETADGDHANGFAERREPG
jgi:hypothetical protein